MRVGLESGQISTGAGFRVRPHSATAVLARLALGLALSVCGANALAQSAPAQTPPAPVEPAKPAPAPVLQVAPPPEPLVGAGEHPDTPSATANVNLPRVNVQGQRNVFNDNDKKLKDLQESLPCAGCDAKPHVKKKLVKRVLDAVGERVLPTEAPDHSTHDANDKAAEFSQEGNCSAANPGGCVQGNLKP